jgi:hypothetical protein
MLNRLCCSLDDTYCSSKYRTLRENLESNTQVVLCVSYLD